jgi:hypothetical protein
MLPQAHKSYNVVKAFLESGKYSNVVDRRNKTNVSVLVSTL